MARPGMVRGMQADRQLLRDVQIYCDEESRGIVAATIVTYCSAVARNSRTPELSTEQKVREEEDNLKSLLSYLRMRKFAVDEVA